MSALVTELYRLPFSVAVDTNEHPGFTELHDMVEEHAVLKLYRVTMKNDKLLIHYLYHARKSC